MTDLPTASPPPDFPDRSKSTGPELVALIVDWGGVLTSPLPAAMAAWCAEDDIEYADFARVLRELLGAEGAVAATNPVHALERGELAVPHFEERLAERLRSRSGAPVPAQGLLTRMFGAFDRAPEMADVVRRARSSGLRTALLSNSWGLDYPRDDWVDLFDAVVISGEVGMRKPDPDIYYYAARQLEVAPASCVMVDDLAPNVRGAAAVGMIGVHHVAMQQTVVELEALFGRRLTG